MKDIKTIQIPREATDYVERCFYEWEGIQKILGYITSKNTLNEHIEYYTKIALEKNYVLERAKTEAVNKFLPRSDSNFSYEFDFDNSCIKYWED